MLAFAKYTHEEAIRQTLRDDPGAAGRIIAAARGDTITCRITFEYNVPAAYAKAVLADVSAEAVEDSSGRTSGRPGDDAGSAAAPVN